MADSSLRYIGLTMTVSFAVSVAIMAWQRTAAVGSVAANPGASPVAASFGAPQDSRRPAAQRETPVAAIPLPPNDTPSAPVAVPAAQEPEAVSPGEALPVVMHVRNRRDQSEIDGDIRNISSRPLDITLRAENDRNDPASEIRLHLGPGERKLFSQNDGLLMQAQDRLVAESSPYDSRTIRIP